MINVTVWNEFRHEKTDDKVKAVYPDGIHNAIKAFLDVDEDITVRTATLDEPEHGLTDEVLDKTDVLLWWGHCAHGEVEDAIVDKVQKKVLQGMGLIVLHSGHYSKIFQRMMGTSCSLSWREIGERERVWVIEPNHPIAQGLPDQFVIEHEEMYGERFDVPQPDETVFIGWFKGGEVFRSGITYKRGHGKIFYFQPGHESHPTYHIPEVQTVIRNAVRWAAPLTKFGPIEAPNAEPLEEL